MKRATEETEALIARAVPYGDAHLILTLLTRAAGRRSVIARNARSSSRRFVGGLPTCARLEVRFTVPDASLGSLERAEVLERWDGLAADPVRTAQAAVVLELASHVVGEAQPAPLLWDSLVRFFRFFEHETLEPRIDGGWARVQLLLLDAAGWLPDLQRSARSHQPIDALERPVWVPDAGIVDESERYESEHGIPLSADATGWLATVAGGRFGSATPAPTRRAALSALEQVWSALLERRPNAFIVLESLRA